MGPDVHSGPLRLPAAEPGSPALPESARPSRAREYLEAVLVSVVFALFVRTFLLQAYVVPTPSMEDQILVGDHLIVNKFVYAPSARLPWRALLPQHEVRRGEIFVFKFPEDPRRDFVKRAVALPGDRVEIRDKTLFVNDERRQEPEARHRDRRVFPADPGLPEELRVRDQYGPRRLAAGELFALGDNRDSSNDSRFWGPVPLANVKGRALFVYWSFPPQDPGGGVFRRIGGVISQTRWSRTFKPVR